MQPVAEIQEPVIHRQQDHRYDARNGYRPVGVRLVIDIDDLFPLPFAGLVLPPVDDVGRQRRAAKPVGAVGVVMETHLQRDQPVLSQIEGLLRLLLLEVPEMNAAAIFQMPDLFQIKPRHEGVGRRPFRRRHHIVAGLVPEIITERDVAHRVFPSTDDVEILVQMQVAPRGLALGIAEHGDNDLRSKAMHGVRRRQVRPCLDFTTFDDFVKPRRPRVGGGIDDMDVGRAHARHQQIAAAHRTVIET